MAADLYRGYYLPAPEHKQFMKHTKLIAITLMAVGLAAGLITSKNNVQAEQPARDRNSTVLIGFDETYAWETNRDGQLYRAVVGFHVDMYQPSQDAPQIEIGTSLPVAISTLKSQGFSHERSISWDLEIHGRRK